MRASGGPGWQDGAGEGTRHWQLERPEPHSDWGRVEQHRERGGGFLAGGQTFVTWSCQPGVLMHQGLQPMPS